MRRGPDRYPVHAGPAARLRAMGDRGLLNLPGTVAAPGTQGRCGGALRGAEGRRARRARRARPLPAVYTPEAPSLPAPGSGADREPSAVSR